MRAMAAMGLLLRRIRSQLAAVLLVGALVAWTTFLVAAGPRLFDRAADEALRKAVADAPAVQRTLELTSVVPTDGSPQERSVAQWSDDGDLMASLFPESVKGLLGAGNLAITTPRMSVSNPPSYPLFVTLRFQQSLEDAVDLVEGSWPVGTGARLPPVLEPDDSFGGARATNHSGDPPRQLQVAMLESSARALGLEVGSRMKIALDPTDTLLQNGVYRFFPIQLAPTELVVTGLYRVLDPDSDAWFGESALRVDDLGQLRDEPVALIDVYVPPDAIPDLEGAGLPFLYQWRYPVLVDRLDAQQLDAVDQGLRLLGSSRSTTLEQEGFTLHSNLLPLLERYQAQRAASTAILIVAAMGPLALAGATIVMAALLLAGRRRTATVLARVRGASRAIVLATESWEALLVAGVACLAGLTLAAVLVPGPSGGSLRFAPLAVGIAAAAALVLASWLMTRRPLTQADRVDAAVRRFAPRRLVAELTLVAIALVGAFLLRQRGLGVGEPGETTTFDPFLAAVPPLVGLAVGVVAIRLYPIPLAVLGRIAARRRDLVPALGLWTVARYAATGLSLVVLLVATAFGAFASIVSASVEQAQRQTSWVDVGADYRFETVGAQQNLPRDLDPSSVPGVEATAAGLVAPGIKIRVGVAQQLVTQLTAVEPAAYETVTAGSPIQPAWPAAFGALTPGGSVPALVSTRLAASAGLAGGSTVSVTIVGRSIDLEVVDIRPALPGLVSGNAFIVVPLDQLQAVIGHPALEPTSYWLRAPADAGPAIEQAAAGASASVRLVSRYERYAALQGQPLVDAVGTGFGLALIVSATFTGLTIIGALTLSAGRRSRDLTLLGTLGVDGRQATGLTLVEHGPPVVLALVPGLALGLAIALLMIPALGLNAFTGSTGPVEIVVDWASLAGVTLGLLALAAVSIAAGTWLSRRTVVINALRMGDD